MGCLERRCECARPGQGNPAWAVQHVTAKREAVTGLLKQPLQLLRPPTKRFYLPCRLTSSLFTRPRASGTGLTPTIMHTCAAGRMESGVQVE